MNRWMGRNSIWVSMLISSVFPMILGFVLADVFVEWRWSHYPFHAMVESVGALSALTIATLMIIMIKSDHLSPRFILVACALIGMGLLDGFHSVLHVGVTFVWLHSIATMVGGVLFALIWFPESWLTKKSIAWLQIFTVTGSLLIGIVSVIVPDILPAMVVDGQFSLLAKIINIAGGSGFLIGSSFFIYSYYSQTADVRDANKSFGENMIFANHSMLFGIAGLLFETSVLWDAGWWWWHLLRFLAYFVVLVYFFSLFKKSQEQLRLNEIKLLNNNIQLELRVQERTKELERASNAKSDFLSQMSHELRTPMNAILGFGQLLKMNAEGLDETQLGNVEEILEAGNHLLSLINEVLDLAIIESGKMEIVMENVSVDEVLQQCITLIRSQMETRNLELIDHVSSKGHKVYADSFRFKQVLINLLSNAVKYNRLNGHIKLESENIGEKYLRIRVSDSGEGMSKEDLQKLFMPFERLNTLTNIEGSGIGLVITRNLMELMGGCIGVESTPGKGSVFWIELPLFKTA